MRPSFVAMLLAWLVLPSSAAARPWFVSAGSLKGEPTIQEGAVGFFIWKDQEGLHLRWTTDQTPRLFSGRMDLDKPLGKLQRVRKEAGGWVQAHGKQIVLFSSTSRGEVDGIDLQIPGGRRVRLELHIDGVEPLPAQIFLGEKGNHPKGLPLILAIR